MSRFPKIFELILKISGAALISVLIVYAISGQYDQQRKVANKAFDSLRESLISMIPESVEEDNSDMNRNDVMARTNLDLPLEPPKSRTEPSEKPKRAFSAANRAFVWEVADETTDNNTPLQRRRPPRSIWLERRMNFRSTLPDSEKIATLDRLMNLELEIPFINDFPELQVTALPENMVEKIGSIKGLIAHTLEIGINDASVNENQIEAYKNALEEADRTFDISELNFTEIIDFSQRFYAFIELKKKMVRIGNRMGADPECNYHVPKLLINENLEITGYYLPEECHPELAEKIMKSITQLPDWKKLIVKEK